MIKIVYCIRRHPSLSPEQFQRYWLENHAAVTRTAPPPPGLVRYTQSHTFIDPQLEPIVDARPGVDRFDGVAEIWWKNIESMIEASRNAYPKGFHKILLEDEAKFIDVANSSIFYCHEHVITEGQ